MTTGLNGDTQVKRNGIDSIQNKNKNKTAQKEMRREKKKKKKIK